MKPRIVKFNETQYYSDEILSKVKNVYVYYVYDASKMYHLCDLRPSYELEVIYTDVEVKDNITEEEADETTMDVYLATNGDIMYNYCEYIDSIESKEIPYDYDEDLSYDYNWDNMIDKLRGNPIWL